MAVSSTDQLPIYRDILDRPLAFGRIYYYEVGTTTPKTVYSDRNLTIPVTNPQLLTPEGRTVTQIFLASGTYTIRAFVFNGVDPYTEPDDSWSLDHEWKEDGPAAAGGLSGTIPTCDNIQELRTTSYTGGVTRTVLGYYDIGDIHVRTYQWNALSLAVDNGGTVIRNPLYATGAWLLVIGDTDVIDVRDFGVMPGRLGSLNSQIEAVGTFGASATNSPRAIYFPAGVYQVSSGSTIFQSKVIYEEGCSFKNLTAGAPYVLQHNSTFEIRGNTSLAATGSLGVVTPTFQNLNDNSEVDPRWLGAALDGIADDGPVMERVIAATLPNYTIRLYGNARLTTLTADLKIYNKVKTYFIGGFTNNQSTYYIEFYGPGSIDNSLAQRWPGQLYPVFAYQNVEYYKFINYEIHSSWFASPLNGTFETDLIDNYLKAWNTNATAGTKVFLDYPGQKFSTGGCTYTSLDHFDFVWVRGTVRTQGSNWIYLRNFSAPADIIGILGAYFAIWGGTISGNWWDNLSNAVKAAFAGGSNLDLQGASHTLSGSIQVSTVRGTGPRITGIRNGKVTYNSGVSLVELLANAGTLNVDGLELELGAYASSLLTVNGCYLTNLLAKNITADGTNLTTQSLIRLPTSGYISYVDFSGSNITCRTMFDDAVLRAGSVYNIHDNNLLRCDNTFAVNKASVTGNHIQGQDDKIWSVGSTVPASIKGNSVYQCDLSLSSSASVISHNVRGNSMVSTDTKLSRVLITSNQALTVVNGLVVRGNSFTGTLAANSTMIAFVSNSTWAATGHSMDIGGNTGEVVETYTAQGVPLTYRVLVPSTSGRAIIPYLKSDIPVGYTDVGDSFVINTTPPQEMLVVPGAQYNPMVAGNTTYTGVYATGASSIGNKMKFDGCVSGYQAPLKLMYTVLLSVATFGASANWTVLADYDLYPYKGV